MVMAVESLKAAPNLRFLHRLLEDTRAAISADRLPALLDEWGVADPA